MSRHRGFTLTELLAALSIAAILLALAVPAFNDLIDRGRLTSAADRLYADMQFARSEAIRNNQNVTISFQVASGSTAGCYGMVLGGGSCDCSVANSCTLKQVSATDLTGVSMLTASSTLGFDPIRGIATNTSTATLQSTKGLQAQVSVALLGRVSLCSPAGSGYTTAYPSC